MGAAGGVGAPHVADVVRAAAGAPCRAAFPAVTRAPAAARAATRRAAARAAAHRAAARPSARRSVSPARRSVSPARCPAAAARAGVVAHRAGAASVVRCVGTKLGNGHLASAGGCPERDEREDPQRSYATKAVLAGPGAHAWIGSRHGTQNARSATRGKSRAQTDQTSPNASRSSPTTRFARDQSPHSCVDRRGEIARCRERHGDIPRGLTRRHVSRLLLVWLSFARPRLKLESEVSHVESQRIRIPSYRRSSSGSDRRLWLERREFGFNQQLLGPGPHVVRRGRPHAHRLCARNGSHDPSVRGRYLHHFRARPDTHSDAHGSPALVDQRRNFRHGNNVDKRGTQSSVRHRQSVIGR